MSPNLRNTCDESNRPLCRTSWNQSSDVNMMFFPEKESISKEEPAHQTRILGWLEENMKEEDIIKKELWESEEEKGSLSKQLPVQSLVSPHEKPLAEMGDSLLDCIIKESPIKDVSYFLTQPHGSLYKIYPSFGAEGQFSGEGNLNLTGKTPSPKGDTAVTDQQLDSSNTCGESNNSFSSDSLYENFMNKPALMQSNRELKRTMKNHVIQYKKRGSAHRKFLESEVPTADKKSLCYHSETSLAPKAEYKQEGASDEVILSTHKAGSPCLSPYEASPNACKTQYSKCHLEQLPFQEQAMNFSGDIKQLEQSQQKQTQMIDFQCDDTVLKKKIQDREKLLLREGDLGLDEVTKRMKQNQKEQSAQIIDSYSEKISQESNLKELEMETVQQQHFEETVNKLKKDIEDLREGKGKVSKEKNDAKNWLVVMQEVLCNATKHLQEIVAEKEVLLHQVEELKCAYCLLQKQHETELRTKSRTQYLDRDHTICRREEKIRELQHLKQKLEHEAETVTSALQELREEKENTEKGLLSLQTKYQGRKDSSLAERQQLGSKYNQLAAQLKILQAEFENEQAEREKMQQQLCEFRIENQKLQQQSAKDQERNRILQLETARWKKKYDKVRESQIIKAATSSVLSDLPQKKLKSGKDCLSTFNVQRISQLLSKVCSILALADGHIMCQDTDYFSVIEHNRKNEAIVQLQEEVKNLTLKKKTLEKKIEKLKNHLELKEEECKRLTGENGKLHEDLRSMTLKVVSYEKITAHPDERLESPQKPQ
ncbi:cancer-associated gene 1 protein [Nothoprocta perdicaria]|uniref:cancer-associated gene 1 protein n=1 Tax=Nothoprocta perdicaria TaxID=30464 RepID=UPI000E1B5881|nr:cancer-associated gene 1 protein [Nothoprocta perdicaria]